MNKENKINSDKLLVDSNQLLDDNGENSLTTNHSQLITTPSPSPAPVSRQLPVKSAVSSLLPH